MILTFNGRIGVRCPRFSVSVSGQPKGWTPNREGIARNSKQNTSAFTLIEVVISSALMALILVSAYLCLNAGFASQKLIEPRVEAFQNARVALALIAADLRSACSLSKDFDFLGMHRMLGEVEADNLDFATHNYTPRRAREGDYCQVSYFLQPDGDTGQFVLWRRRNPTIGIEPLSGGNREEIARGLRGLKFEYYDGFDWYDDWGDAEGKKQNSARVQYNMSGMPEAVRITLLVDAEPRSKTTATPETSSEKDTSPPPLVFQTIARLNLAAATQSSSSGSSSTNSAPPDAAPDANGGQN